MTAPTPSEPTSQPTRMRTPSRANPFTSDAPPTTSWV